MSVKDEIDRRNTLARMIKEPEKNFIGDVFKLDYQNAWVLTNDAYKERVCGIPLNSFLLGASFNPNDFTNAKEQEKIVFLFRMLGSCEIPGDSDKIKTLIEHYQSKSEIYSDDEHDNIEPITHSWLQFGGLECEIIGSFYMEDGKWMFGADIEDYQSMAGIKVYKPVHNVLQAIVNYIDPYKKQKMKKDASKMGFHEAPEPFLIGNLRYTSTNRLQKLNKDSEVEVKIHPADFLSRRTAVFGMTRTGKSNTVKTIISAVCMAAKKAKIKIGQLVFDMNGEYANANGQDDGSSINDVFFDNTVRYRGLETQGFFDLRDDFYSSLENGLEIIKSHIEQSQNNLSDSMQKFLGLEISNDEPQEPSEKTRWYKKRAIYHCMLHNMGFGFQGKLKCKFEVSKEIWLIMFEYLQSQNKFDTSEISHLKNQDQRVEFMKDKYGDPANGLEAFDMKDFLVMVRDVNLGLKKINKELKSKTSKRNWLDSGEEAMLNIIVGKNDSERSINTKSLFQKSLSYHSPKGNKNIKEDIFNHLKQGRVVILDLSVGLQSVKANMSDKIAKFILEKNIDIVNQNLPAMQCVLYVEEAHNLIGKNSNLDQTWPRIAKEGAKFGLALVYATQEPSSVHPNILANTENLFVTHLNNDDELKSLSKYYDFKSFAQSLKKAQDVGFARIKTLSSNYVIPTQIKLFDPNKLKLEYQKLPNHPDFISAPDPDRRENAL